MALLPNAFHVARREYLFRVRGRAFLITTGLLGLAIVAVTMLPTILGAVGVADPPRVAIDVQADGISTDPVLTVQTALIVGLDPTADPTSPPVEGERARVTRTDDPEAAAAEVRDGELDGLLTITRGADDDLAFEYLGSASPTNMTRLLVTQAASAIAIADRLDRAGVDPRQSAEIFRPADFTAQPVDPNDPATRTSSAAPSS